MAQRPQDDPRYYSCPQCKKGIVDFLGKDSQKRNAYQCNKCGAQVGEPQLESAARKRVRED